MRHSGPSNLFMANGIVTGTACGTVGTSTRPASATRSPNGSRQGSPTRRKSQRHTFGGLTDQSFGLISLLEAGHSVNWPFNGDAVRGAFVRSPGGGRLAENTGLGGRLDQAQPS